MAPCITQNTCNVDMLILCLLTVSQSSTWIQMMTHSCLIPFMSFITVWFLAQTVTQTRKSDSKQSILLNWSLYVKHLTINGNHCCNNKIKHNWRTWRWNSLPWTLSASARYAIVKTEVCVSCMYHVSCMFYVLFIKDKF